MKKYIISILCLFIFVASCNKTETEVAVYDPTLYAFDFGHFPPPNLPEDNTLTNAGVELGRMLFYEKKLSRGNGQACADCHLQVDGFTDIRQFSLGVAEEEGKRQAMSVFNMAWHNNGFFWDGRAEKLRDQALLPIQDPLEMDETLENVVAKLKAEKTYTNQFIRAFDSDNITSEKIALALEQFMFSIVSMNAKYDRFLKGEESLSESEERGRALFFKEFDPFTLEKGGECFHCHNGMNFTNDRYMNNGLDFFEDITDKGRFETTGFNSDIGKFKVTSLRNIVLTAPYMHDGRFETLDEVLEHYNTGVKDSETVHPLLQFNLLPNGLQLTAENKADIIAFLHTLTDDNLMENKAYSNPFE
ncbi:MAG: cytochrome-c peroxidase [Chitinophagales bacterium]